MEDRIPQSTWSHDWRSSGRLADESDSVTNARLFCRCPRRLRRGPPCPHYERRTRTLAAPARLAFVLFDADVSSPSAQLIHAAAHPGTERTDTPARRIFFGAPVSKPKHDGERGGRFLLRHGRRARVARARPRARARGARMRRRVRGDTFSRRARARRRRGAARCAARGSRRSSFYVDSGTTLRRGRSGIRGVDAGDVALQEVVGE